MGKLTDKVAKGVFWVLMEKFGIQAAHFVVTLVLARLLTPNDYGTVALLSVFVAVSNVLVDSGFSKALVQKKDATQTDYNTVFYISMALAAVLYSALFFSAPLVAKFYDVPELGAMLRVMALSLVFHSLNNVQGVEMNRKMLFHLSFRISWARVAVSAAVGVALALAGYGPWALVWASVSGGVAGVIARQLVIRWRPTLSFSWDSARSLFRFGWKMMAASLLNSVFSNLYALVIGKFYTKADLAFVKKGSHIPKLIGNTADATLSKVTFPALVRLQDDPAKLRNAMRRMIKCSTFVVFPLMACSALVAEPMVALMYGDRWLPIVPFVQLTCFAMAFKPFDSINFQAINARGRSDIYLKLIVLRRVAGLLLMALALPYGVMTFMVCSAIVYGPIGVVMNSLPNRNVLKYSIAMQLCDVLPSLALTVVLAAVVFGIGCIPVGGKLLLFPQVAVGFAVYGALAVWLRFRPVGEFADMLLPHVRKRSAGLSRPVEWLSRRCSK